METSRLIKSLEKTLKLYGEVPPYEKPVTEESRVYTLFNKIKQTIELSENPKQTKNLKHFLNYIKNHLSTKYLDLFKKIFPLSPLENSLSNQMLNNISSETTTLSTQKPPSDTLNLKTTRVTHSNLEKLIRILGFIGNPQGVCNGIAKISLEFLIFNNTDLFYQNLENIDLILEKLEKDGKSLDDVKKDDLKNICDQISPTLYPKIQNFICKIDLNFNYFNYKNILEQSKSFDRQIENVCNLFGVYEQQELTTLIKELINLSVNAIAISPESQATKSELIEMNELVDFSENSRFKPSEIHPPSAISSHIGRLNALNTPSIEARAGIALNAESLARFPLAFKFESTNHTLTVRYDIKNKNWFFIDSNALLITKTTNLQEKITQHFNSKLPIFLIVSIFTKKLEFALPPSIQAQLKNLQKISYKNCDKNYHFVSEDGNSLLYKASYMEDLEIVKLLLAHKNIRVNQATSNGSTPLSIACHEGHVEVVKLLLSHKDIQVNQANFVGFTSLSTACQKGHIEVVKLLLSHKDIQVNQANFVGFTSLWTACHEGRVEIVKLLLSHKDIQVNQADCDGFTPLNIACEKGHVKVVKLLLSHKDIQVNQADCDGFTPLNIACQNGHIEIVKLLLSHKDTQVNQANCDGFTPLNIACQNGHIEIVKLLLSHKDTQVNQANCDGVTPLDIAYNYGYKKIIYFLLKKIKKSNLTNETKNNTKSKYKKRNYQEIVKTLEPYEETDKRPDTPLKKKQKDLKRE